MKKVNQYREIEKKIQDIISAMPIRYAFGQEQFNKNVIEYFGFKSMNEAHEKLYDNGYGGYYLRTDSDLIKEAWDKIHKMKEAAIKQDIDGTGAFNVRDIVQVIVCGRVNNYLIIRG